MLSSFWFIFLNSASVYLAYQLSGFPSIGRDLDTRILSTLILYGIITSAIVLTLGIAGLLFSGPAALLLLLGMAVTFLLRKRREQNPAALESLPHRGISTYLLDPSLNVALAIVFGLFSVYVFHGAFDGTHFGYDDLSYHATGPAHWLQQERITLAPANYHAYYPFGAELLSTWFMLPFHSDSFASLAGLYWLALATMAIAGTVLKGGGDIPSAAMSGGLFMSSNIVQGEALGVFTSADLAGTAYVLTAIYFLYLFKQVSFPKNLVFAALLALSSGLAAGTKVTYVASVSVIAIFAFFSIGGTWRRQLVVLTGMLILASAMGSFWYVRNAVNTGNPLFPAALGPFGGPLDIETVARTKLVTWLAEAAHDPRILNTLIWKHLDWGPALGLIALVGLAAGLRTAIIKGIFSFRYAAGDKPAWPRIGPVVAVLVMMLWMYPHLPFSGTINDPTAELAPSVRYMLLAFALSMVLFGWFLGANNHRELWWGAAILAVITSWTRSTLHPYDSIVALGGAIVGLGIIHFIARRQPWVPKPSRIIAMGAAMFFIILAASKPIKDQRTEEYLNIAYPALSELIEKLPEGSRITWFGGIRYYPIFGRRLQHAPVPVNADGGSYKTTYSLWKLGEFQWWRKLAKLSAEQGSHLISNLVDQKIQYVLIEGNRQTNPWLDILEADPGTRRIHSNENFTLFELATPP